MHVTFNKSNTKSSIEGTSNTINGRIYFTNDGNNVVPGSSVQGGGLYVGTGGSPMKVATNVIVEDNLSSESTTNALSARQGKVLNDRITTWTDTQLSQGGMTIDYTEASYTLSFLYPSTPNPEPFMTRTSGGLLFRNLSSAQ